MAVEQYAIAERNAPSATDAIRYRIAIGGSEASLLLGRYEEAAQRMSGATELVQSPIGKATVEMLQGQVAFKQGDLNASISYHESGLARLGVRAPKSTLGFGVGVFYETFVQTIHSLFPGRLHSQSYSRESALINTILNHLAQGYCLANMLKLIWAGLSGMNRAERLPPSPELAFNYGVHSGFASLLGWYSRAQKYSAKSIELRLEAADNWGLGQSYGWQGIGLYASGRFEEGVVVLQQAVESFTRTGDLWELNMARFHLGCCYWRLGRMVEAAECARDTFETSIRIGDSRSHCSLLLWSRTVDGELPFSDLEGRFELAAAEIMPTCNMWIGKARWQLAQQETEAAIATLEQAWKSALKNFMVNFHTLAALIWLGAALRVRAGELADVDVAQCKKLRKRALRVAKRASWMSRLFPADYPHALRELALVYADMGRTKKAIQALDKSCALAEKQKAAREYSQSMLERACLAQSLEQPGAAEKLEAAQAEVDRFNALVKSAATSVALRHVGA